MTTPPEIMELMAIPSLPDSPGTPDNVGWEWGGSAMTYYPGGDADGPVDGYPGSLFGTGHNWNQYVSEISIPAPVISPGKNPSELFAEFDPDTEPPLESQMIDLVDEIVSGALTLDQAGANRVVTMLFADIRGFVQD